MASAGIRIDYNSYRDIEYQPSVRLLYTPKPNQSAWLAVSRAVRTPNRVDRDISFDLGTVEVFGLPMTLINHGLEIDAIGSCQNRRGRIPLPVRPAMVGGYFRLFQPV